MAYLRDLADVWNDSGTTFTALKMNVTDTASNSASKLLDLQVGGSSQVYIAKNGDVTWGGSPAFRSAATICVDPTMYFNNATIAGSRAAASNGFIVGSIYTFRWSSTSAANGSPDLYLYRDAANTLALRNSTNAQRFNIYETYTDASNYARGYVAGTTSGLDIGTEAAGTGTKRPVRILGPSLASAEAVSILELSQTWNTTGTPTAIKLNVTDTASNAASKLLDLQVGGSSLASINKAGRLGLVGSAPSASYALNAGTNAINVGIVSLSSLSGYIGWSDTYLYRDAANTLALRNSTNAQAFNVYNTYTDASNYERGFARWSSNVFQIGTEKAGTGSARDVYMMRNGSIVTHWKSGAIDISGQSLQLINNSNLHISESSAAPAASANAVRIYAEDDGSGKTRLMALFGSGAAQQIVIEP